MLTPRKIIGSTWTRLQPDQDAIAAPLVEGTVSVGPKRVLGFAEFGDPAGKPVFWFHGTPGARRQVAPLAREAATHHKVRIVCVERPGSGSSTAHGYRAIADIAPDIERVADALGIDEFGVVGLSGGGPYTLACAAAMPARVVGAAVLGGVAPTVGPEAAEGGLPSVCPKVAGPLEAIEAPVSSVLRGLLKGISPFADPLYAAFSSFMPEGDKRVFASHGVKEMFIDDIMNGIHGGGVRAGVHDVVLFGREWGFRVADVTSPVFWWHGDDDTIVPLAHGEHMASLLPNCTFTMRPGDSHLSGYAAADEVVDAMASCFA